MTKQELIELLADMPDHAEVVFKAEIVDYEGDGSMRLELKFEGVTHPPIVDSKPIEKFTIWLEE